MPGRKCAIGELGGLRGKGKEENIRPLGPAEPVSHDFLILILLRPRGRELVRGSGLDQIPGLRVDLAAVRLNGPAPLRLHSICSSF